VEIFLKFHLDEESGTCSIMEIIHSYRNSIEDSFPDWTSEEAVEALNKIKEIKNEISTGK